MTELTELECACGDCDSDDIVCNEFGLMLRRAEIAEAERDQLRSALESLLEYAAGREDESEAWPPSIIDARAALNGGAK